jgi:trans-aconitate 2-methyltransferase
VIALPHIQLRALPTLITQPFQYRPCPFHQPNPRSPVPPPEQPQPQNVPSFLPRYEVVRLQRRKESVRRGTRESCTLYHASQRRRSTLRKESQNRYRLVQNPDPALAPGRNCFYTVHMSVIMSHILRQHKEGEILGREWDAAEYEKLSAPQTRWGAGVLGRLDLRGDEAVIDAGCGTGRVTELLLERLPQGSVLAVDRSMAMVEAARRRFAGEPRVRVERRDLLDLEVEERVDLIFSTATFHWIKDHDRLFEKLAGALKPHGRLIAQCGGEGNISRAMKAVEETVREERFRGFFEGWRDEKYFADPQTTARRLRISGFEDVETWLHDEVAAFDSVDDLARFLGVVVLGGHLERLPEEERAPFAAEVAEKVAAIGGAPALDYVRLNITARKVA